MPPQKPFKRKKRESRKTIGQVRCKSSHRRLKESISQFVFGLNANSSSGFWLGRLLDLESLWRPSFGAPWGTNQIAHSLQDSDQRLQPCLNLADIDSGSSCILKCFSKCGYALRSHRGQQAAGSLRIEKYGFDFFGNAVAVS